ncbi:MAG TPA: PhnD/SsuA/transferrin family substrate-binding protein [Pseudomonas sp.]|uniref:phosphate/phosphite/phosphonate ABC transporter substrate-binding protein n=1 Tax=Pseudomonas sp. TaxID=306 RepID=UPI002ED94510
MSQGFAQLPMYVAPLRVREAQEAWLARTLEHLAATRMSLDTPDLKQLWLSPDLLLAQTCGYPLMTLLRDRVQVIGRPVYQLPHSRDGNHCSLLVAREGDSRRELIDFFGSHGLINSEDSNSGMNLFRHTLAPLQRDGRFFSEVSLTGGHRDSLLWLRQGRGDLAAIDSVTYDYLARDNSDEVRGLKIVTQTAPSPCLPYITRLGADAGSIRLAMNKALRALPDVAAVLAISEVITASEDDYQVLLAYQRQAEDFNYPAIL